MCDLPKFHLWLLKQIFQSEIIISKNQKKIYLCYLIDTVSISYERSIETKYRLSQINIGQ